MRYLDDILVLIGLVLLGAAIWQAQGATATTAYAGAILIIVGVALGWQGRASR